ncbi:spore gernimation protein GerPD [Pueribacillus sp. YX66]|uniref:spore gernimation protein GerPD n=1 Tax=Pueribacillus sp. YX66 TaxID=3229242 RepID=UPI00358D491B
MRYYVVNRGLAVGNIRILGVASSSLVLIGDADMITLGSVFDTPPESYIVGAQVAFTNR